jgi:hypothetical protein
MLVARRPVPDAKRSGSRRATDRTREPPEPGRSGAAARAGAKRAERSVSKLLNGTALVPLGRRSA